MTLPEHDSLAKIALDASTYAEGASEPEFSQFLEIEARIMRLLRVRASLGPHTDALADALEALVRPQLDAFNVIGQPGSAMANAVAALRQAGRLS